MTQTEARMAFLRVLVLRLGFVTFVERELAGFPPEIREAATRKASEHGANELLKATLAVQDIVRMDGAPKSREEAFRRNYAVGVVLGMDPNDPNMRLWSGESITAIFGL